MNEVRYHQVFDEKLSETSFNLIYRPTGVPELPTSAQRGEVIQWCRDQFGPAWNETSTLAGENSRWARMQYGGVAFACPDLALAFRMRWT
jgi:hypothetical protein